MIDPDLGVNIVDLGFVRQVEIQDRTAVITMTLTSAACPLTSIMEDQIRTELAGLSDLDGFGSTGYGYHPGGRPTSPAAAAINSARSAFRCSPRQLSAAAGVSDVWKATWHARVTSSALLRTILWRPGGPPEDDARADASQAVTALYQSALGLTRLAFIMLGDAGRRGCGAGGVLGPVPRLEPVARPRQRRRLTAGVGAERLPVGAAARQAHPPAAGRARGRLGRSRGAGG